MVTMIETIRGAPKMIFDGFAYNKHNDLADNRESWRCDFYWTQKCTGLIHADKETHENIKMITQHNHPPSPERIETLLIEHYKVQQKKEAEDDDSPSAKTLNNARKEHFRHILFFFHNKGVSASKAHKEITEVYGPGAISRKCCHWWYAEFKKGRCSIQDEPRPGRPPSDFDIGALEAARAEAPTASTRQLAARLGVNRTSVHRHLKRLGLNNPKPSLPKKTLEKMKVPVTVVGKKEEVPGADQNWYLLLPPEEIHKDEQKEQYQYQEEEEEGDPGQYHDEQEGEEQEMDNFDEGMDESATMEMGAEYGGDEEEEEVADNNDHFQKGDLQEGEAKGGEIYY